MTEKKLSAEEKHEISERVKLTWHNERPYWHPFRHIVKDSNAAIDNIAEELDLKGAQRGYFERLIRTFQLTIWYGSSTDDDKSDGGDAAGRLELVAFWDMEDYCEHLASIDLETLLKYTIDETDMIGAKGTLVALKKLKALIDPAIEEIEKEIADEQRETATAITAA